MRITRSYTWRNSPLAFNQEYLTALFNFTYSHLFNEYNPENVLLLLAIVTIFVSLLSNLFRYMGAWTVENMRTRTLQRMRNEMFSKVVDMNVGYFSDQRKGDIISKITSDVGVVQFCITNTLQVAFREPFLIIGYTVMMVAISWELALFSVLFLPVVALIIGSIVKRLRHPARTSQQRMGELVSTLDESLSGIKVIKSYNATGYVKQKFYDLSEDLARLTLSMARRQQLASPMSEFLGISAVGVILVFGGSLVFKDALSPEGFIAFIAMFSQITRPVRTFIDQFSNINQGIAAGERIFSIIDAQSEIQDKPGAIELDGLKDKIEFRDIHFSYDGSREVIEGISFEIKRGETVALVGPSGGGKSTLSELIPRFYDVKAGDILIDGVSVRDYTQDSLRAHMSVVAQDTVLFNDTIEGNIAMGKAGATHDEIVEAARIANADCFIQEAPEGYQTNIGDRGVKLGRPAPAAFDRTRRAEKPRDTDPRRGHLGPRHGERKTRAGCPQQAARRPHIGGYRPPPVDDSQRRQDHRRRPRPRGRAGHPHRTARQGRHLRQADRIAVVRLKMPACTDERREGEDAGGRMVRPA